MTAQVPTRAPIGSIAASASPLGALSDGALARLASDGSESAFETLDRRHRPAVYRHCIGILRNAHDADEAAQRTMIRAYRALERGRGPASFLPWLLAIARNESFDIIRGRKGTESLSIEIEAGGETPSEHAERREQVEELKGDLTELPEAQRKALLLRGVGDLSHAEIARLMGGTPTEMRTLVHEARASLAEFEAGRALPCADVRGRIATGDGRALRARRVRAHIRVCEDCAAAAAAVGARRVPAGRVASFFPVPLFAAIRAALFGSGQAGVVGSAGPVGAVGVSAAVVASLVIGLGGGGSGGGSIGSTPVTPAVGATTAASAVSAAPAASSAAPGSAPAAGSTRPSAASGGSGAPSAAAPGAAGASPAGAAPASPGATAAPPQTQNTSRGSTGAAGVTVPSVGTVSTPSVTVPPVTTPRVTVPPVTVPSVTVPSVTVPPITTPKLPIVGSVTTPQVTTPPIATPPVATPGIELPPIQILPGVQLPGQSATP